MKKIVDLAKNRGFVFQGSEIYGWLANTWDYGPLGSLLKENLKNLWIREMITKHENMMLQDAAILMNPKVWVASGHVGGFSDPLVDCKSCKKRFRADKIIEEVIENHLQNNSEGYWDLVASEKNKDTLSFIERKEIFTDFLKKKVWVDNLIPESWTWDQQFNFLNHYDIGEWLIDGNKKHDKVRCQNCWENNWWKIQNFNLMFKTKQGVTDDSSSDVYLRPETAQGIFVNFPNLVRSSRKKIPFGVGQVGKSFRNEITPGNFIFRTREFEQMEIEFFCAPGTESEWMTIWKDRCKKFLIETLGLKEENMKFRAHDADELSHYSNETYDIEYNYPDMGFSELWGIASRTDFDLKAHMKESGQDMSYFDPVNNTKYVPYVIEPALGLTRLVLATLCDAYDEVEDEKQGSRIVMRFDPKVAPIKVGVLPLQKNKLGEKAREVFELLSDSIVCEYDETGSIGKRYARMDEIGTPWCVTIDFDTLEDESVTVRHRDTGEQERVSLDMLTSFFLERLV